MYNIKNVKDIELPPQRNATTPTKIAVMVYKPKGVPVGIVEARCEKSLSNTKSSNSPLPLVGFVSPPVLDFPGAEWVENFGGDDWGGDADRLVPLDFDFAVSFTFPFPARVTASPMDCPVFASLYQLPGGSPRHSPTVTKSYPARLALSIMNWVRS